MPLHIVIVGGVAGGMSAATRARRMNEDASIIVLERGGFISFANCGMPYYLAGRIKAENELLVTTPRHVRKRFNIDARVNSEVARIDRKNREVEVLDRTTGHSYRLGYDKLILAVGASAIVPPIQNVRAPNVFMLRSMEDVRQVHDWLKAQMPKSAVIVGAGFIGLEMAEAMRERGLAVTVIEKASHVLPPLDAEMAAPIHAELVRNEVRVIAGTGLKALHALEAGAAVNSVEVEDGRRFEADMVLLSIGVRPNVSLASDAGLTVGPSAGIAVDAFQRTSDPDIYAVGDVAELMHGVTRLPARVPLAGPANRQGRLAGEHAATGSASPAGKVLGTAIVQIFGLTAAMTGLGEELSRRSRFDTPVDVDVAYVLPKDHAGYYPGATAMSVKLVYDRLTGRVLGAQIVGQAGVDKRIDVIATTIHFGGTIDDLASIDLAYAPQFGSAKDAVHIAALVAQNQRRKLTSAVAYTELRDQVLLDVRTPSETAQGSLPNAIKIPLDELRGRLGELDPNRPIVAYCHGGQRGYVAQRILRQHGFSKVSNLKGGIELAERSGARIETN